MYYRLRWLTSLFGGLGLALSASLYAHPGGTDDNGGHLNRITGEYHCHRADCVLPTVLSHPPASRAISVASFNIQFLGNSTRRDDAALAEVIAGSDIVVVQELVSPPFPGTFPDGQPFSPDKESAEFFDAMTSLGFDFLLSPEDTGTGNRIHRNGSSTEWWVAFYRPEVVEPANDIPNGYLAEDRSNHDDYERVPYAFAFRSLDGALDFVIVSVHLKPGSGNTDAARRAHELASIAGWINDNDDAGERDFIIVGDMNIEDCGELAQAVPQGFASLNDTCIATNTNVNGPKPYDHMLYRETETTAQELPRAMAVTDLVEAMELSWSMRHTGSYPGNPYDHNRFRAVYSDHHPIVFEMTRGNVDDDG